MSDRLHCAPFARAASRARHQREPANLPAPDSTGRQAVRSALARADAPASPSAVRPKLTVNRPGDAFELEADRAAAQVMRMPDPGAGHHGPLRMQALTSPAPGPGMGAAPPQVHQALRSPGRPLDPATRAFMEARFGSDFGCVRIHTDAEGAESAEAVNAKAYTVGSHIVFGAERYRPETDGGRHLLAHELAHTLQGGGDDGGLHRAEVEDKDSVCANLTDIKPTVNQHVNDVLKAARTSPGLSDLALFLQEVIDKTGGDGAVSPIEKYIEGLPANQQFQPSASLAGTRFDRLPNASGLGIAGISIPGLGSVNMYNANAAGIHVVGPTVKINGFCVGGDKLGHFFQQGWQYLTISVNSSVANAESFGRATEIDRAGLATTGVYSRADLVANRVGMDFWNDLAGNPSGLVFDISKYISADWNEYVNTNYYEASVASQVWATQLTGAWQGGFGPGPAPSSVNVNLTVTPAGAVTGTFTYPSANSGPAGPAGPAAPVTGTLTGTLRFLTTSVSGSSPSTVLHGSAGAHSANPVSGVVIDFAWNAGSQSGQGTWQSAGERRLTGTLGLGSANTGHGTFNIDRI